MATEARAPLMTSHDTTDRNYGSSIKSKMAEINQDLDVYVEKTNKDAFVKLNEEADKGATDKEFKHTQQISDNMSEFVDVFSKEPKKKEEGCCSKFMLCFTRKK